MSNDQNTAGLDPLGEAAKIRDEAMKDMETEGLAEASADEDEVRVRLQFTASYYVENKKTGDTDHGLLIISAKSLEEALGRMYLQVAGEYDYDEGWVPPHLVYDERPTLLISGINFPVDLVDPRVSSPEASESCPTCGDPDGPCEDPKTCLRNPTLAGEPVADEGDKPVSL